MTILISIILLLIIYAYCKHVANSPDKNSNYENRNVTTNAAEQEHYKIKTTVSSSSSITTNTYESQPEPVPSVPDISYQDRYARYKVIGKNPETNRRKTCYVIAKIGTSDDLIAEKTSFLPPFSVEQLEDPEPSDRQLNYARDLGIKFPANCSASDISCLISRCLEDKGAPLVSNDLLAFAADNGVLISPYSSEVRAVFNVMNELVEQDYLAFWVYVIYCVQKSIPVGNFDHLSNKQLFYGLSGSDKYDDLVIFLHKLYREDIDYLFSRKRINCQGSARKAELYHIICDYISQNII